MESRLVNARGIKRGSISLPAGRFSDPVVGLVWQSQSILSQARPPLRWDVKEYCAKPASGRAVLFKCISLHLK
jgi:hypothetical protein